MPGTSIGHGLPACTVVARYASPQPDKPQRRRGRPQTRTAAHYASLIAELQSMAAWFQKAHQRPHRSDVELLTVYLTEAFAREGKRRCRATGPEFAGRLKTLRNELSRARKWLQEEGETSQVLAF
jgi:hypothetical protein